MLSACFTTKMNLNKADSLDDGKSSDEGPPLCPLRRESDGLLRRGELLFSSGDLEINLSFENKLRAVSE